MADYFTDTSVPTTSSSLSSSVIRSVIAAIAAGLAKIAGYTGNGGKVVVINAGGTAQEAVSSLTVAQGGSGRATGTTAYALVATGTTATGAQQTLAAGATTEILVGGGASALPVWTAATGSGAPVRATSPALTTPNVGTPSAGTLTNCTGLPAAGVVGTALVSAAIGTTVQAYDADLTTWAGITPGTGVATALAVNVGSAGAPVLFDGAGGTPTSITLTNAGGTAASLTAGTASAVAVGGITGLGANVGTFLATPTIANLNTAVSDADLAPIAVPSFTTTIGVGAATAANSGAGITFPATQSASTDANTLDDYEEGTWTGSPVNLTVVGTPTYSGTYTKIGRAVHINLRVTSDTSTASTVDSTYFDGLPFTASVDSTITAMNVPNSASLGVCRINSANNRMYTPTWGASAAVVISATYFV
ncbi:MAG: hypothetical protein WC073_11380 [Sterolibacterium sp.]